MNAAHTAAVRSVIVLIAIAVIGCTPNNSDGPFGPAADSPLLSQVSGQWVFEFDKTLAVLKAAGTTDQQIAQLRKLYADNPILGKMHPDLTIKGNVAVGAGTPSSEYRFFAMHKHDVKVCGRAWHREDRFDPGDMSKCYVRLSIVEGDLHFEVNMLDGLPDVDDPDLHSIPAVEGDLQRCNASKQKADDWATYVFSRRM